MAGWETQARDDHGRFASGGGDGGRLSSDSHAATLAYAMGRAGQVNQVLRGGVAPTPETDGITAGMDAAMRELPEDTTLYRVSMDRSEMDFTEHGVLDMPPLAQPPNFMEMEPGTVTTDPAFLSTSTDLGWVENIMTAQGSPLAGPVPLQVVEIDAPAGTLALDVNSTLGMLSPYEHQSEVILPRDTNLEITGHDGLYTQARIRE